MINAERLIQRIIDSPNDAIVGVLANELLREFHRGYPLEKLRPLLLSDDKDLVSIGIWILSEMGEQCKPLLGDALRLLSHPATRVRFWAVDCLFWAPPGNGYAQASVVQLLDDPEIAVRWKVLDIMSRVSRQQLDAALAYLAAREPQSLNVSRLQWLLGPEASKPEEVIAALQSHDRLVRKYAVIAAARMRGQGTAPLIYASTIGDPEIKDFASSWLR